jgi:hypothetical protein
MVILIYGDFNLSNFKQQSYINYFTIQSPILGRSPVIPNSKRFVVIPLINLITGAMGWSAIAMVVGVGYTPRRGRTNWIESAIAPTIILYGRVSHALDSRHQPTHHRMELNRQGPPDDRWGLNLELLVPKARLAMTD